MGVEKHHLPYTIKIMLASDLVSREEFDTPHNAMLFFIY